MGGRPSSGAVSSSTVVGGVARRGGVWGDSGNSGGRCGWGGVSGFAAEAIAGGVRVALGGLFVGRGGAAIGHQSQHFAGLFARIAGEIRGFLATWLTTVLPLQRVQAIPPLAPAPGLPPAWGASASVYGGVVNLGNGNLCLQIPIVGWANGLSFTLVFNSQADPSQPSPIAPKWTHSWNVFVEVSSDGKRATLQEGDGSRWVYNNPDGDGVFTPRRGRLVGRIFTSHAWSSIQAAFGTII